MKTTITLSMIVKNEEQYLRECLDSAAPFVDEIVIVDTGSTDGTIEIAKEFGAKIFSIPWNNNFSDARNEALARCSSDWVLYLDADERIKPGDGPKIKGLITRQHAWAYTVLVEGEHWLPSGKVHQVNAYPRLFRRHPKIQFEGAVHEQILPSIARLHKQVHSSDIGILHLGYGESLERVTEKSMRNISLLEQQLLATPDDDYVKYQLGNSLVVVQKYSRAKEYLRNLEDSASLDRSIRASVCNLMVEIELSTMAVGAAEEWCRRSLRLVPEQVMAKWFLSGILAYINNYFEALQILKSLRATSPSEVRLSHDLVIPSEQIGERAVLCYEMLAKESVAAFDLVTAEKWITEAESREYHSLGLAKIGVEISLSKKDIFGAYPRLQYLVDHLPSSASSQRAQFSSIKAKLENMVAREIS
ncbi:MAG: glycosyltransferase family 2 protein [Bacteroidota bacterium]